MRVTRSLVVDGPIVPAAVLAIVLGPVTTHANEFSFELGAGFLADRSTTTSTFISSQVPPPPDLPTLTVDTDTDEFTIAAAWYFDGASSASGPLSRAAFVSRASSLAVSLSRADVDTDISIDPPIIIVIPDPLPPGPIVPDPPPGVVDRGPVTPGGDIDEVLAQFRYVWPDSGWYVLAGIAFAETELDIGLDTASVDSNGYVAGFGRYIAELTSLDIAVTRVENDFSGPFIGGDDSTTEVAVTLSHIGALTGRWQYGADATISSVDTDDRDGDFGVRGSLYPNRSLAFGLDVAGSFGDSNAPTTYRLFASWFATERFGISASYGLVDFDEPRGVDVDQDQFGLEAVARF